MKIAIVTGANGFIGNALTNYLIELQYKVYAIVRDAKKYIRNNTVNSHLFIVESTYEEYHLLDQKIKEESIDFFFHMAWEFRGNNLYDYNVQVTNIVGACESVKAAKLLNVRRYIFMNSFFVYKKDFYFTSDMKKEVGYSSIYGMCKKNALELTKIIAHSEGIDHLSVMLSNIFGIGDTSNRAINTIIKMMLKGEDVPVIEGKYLYDYIYIDDAVAGIVAVAENGRKNEEYYLGNNALRSFKDFVLDMRNAINPNVNLKFGTFPDTSYIDFREIDLYKIYRDTSFVPKTDIFDAFRKTAEWLGNNNE